MNYYILYVIVLTMLIGFSKLSAQITDKIQINGYSSFEFEKQLGDEGKGDPNGSFDVDLFDLVLNVQATNRLRLATDITWEHGASTEDDRGNAAIEYAFGEYMIYNWLKIRAGKMFVSFGFYNEIHTAKPAFLTVKEPLSTNKNHKFGSDIRFYPRWLAGLAVLGNANLSGIDFDYIVQVSNGEQESTNPFEEDDNKEKALSGRLRFIPIRNLQLGFSIYTDQITEMDTAGEDSGKRSHLFSYGGEAEWNNEKFGLEFEYVTGLINPSSSEKISRSGLTIMGYFTLLKNFTPYLRYEYLDPDKNIEDDQASMFVYGINTRIDDGLFVKVELNTIHGGEMNKRFKSKNYTELKTAVAIGF